MNLSTNPSAEQITALKESRAHGHESNFSTGYVAAARAAYASTYALWQQLGLVEHLGVLEITLHTRTGSVRVPLDADVAMEIVTQVQEMVGGHLDVLQRNILHQLAEVENEKPDQKGESDRAQAFALCMPQAADTGRVVPLHPAATNEAPQALSA